MILWEIGARFRFDGGFAGGTDPIYGDWTVRIEDFFGDRPLKCLGDRPLD